MLTAQQVADAKAAAIADGFANPGPATIALYALNPLADAASVVTALQAIAPAIDPATVTSDITALNTEAQANTPAAQAVSIATQIGGVVLPIAEKAIGL